MPFLDQQPHDPAAEVASGTAHKDHDPLLPQVLMSQRPVVIVPPGTSISTVNLRSPHCRRMQHRPVRTGRRHRFAAEPV